MQGTLAQLDSQNPVMYLDFPQGRLKLFGTLVFPKNKYMMLKLGGSNVLCEDVFENMVSACRCCDAAFGGTHKQFPLCV